MLRSSTTWLVPVALTVISFGSNFPSAIAQTQYPFKTTYNSQTTLTPITENVLRIKSLGENVDAPYGLTRLTNISYGKFNPNTGVIAIEPDPAEFGLENLPFGNLTISGQGEDRLFGTVSGSAILDFPNSVGRVTNTISITGGAGRFSGATGTLLLLENLTLDNPDITAPVRGLPLISGSVQTFQTVPEASQITALLCMGVIGFSGLNRRRSYEKKTKYSQAHSGR
ncbi:MULTISPECIES: hypothetical protein [Nostoc]|uniref:PEP-CTERM sorting domain-containing protein n=2 Tax=Nostoc TaxID=1177 RepID=A0ABR8IAE1_9NOSO|nr:MULTISPECIES: hypothetical protein [Nostoc]MBD2562026.1 hypothetical protein [Nostoc linckia FACHB-391]MBD2648601.1 hypothetical protein [Nostoc foliaceum FACHB-393]